MVVLMMGVKMQSGMDLPAAAGHVLFRRYVGSVTKTVVTDKYTFGFTGYRIIAPFYAS